VVAAARQRAHQETYRRLGPILTRDCKARLDGLLTSDASALASAMCAGTFPVRPKLAPDHSADRDLRIKQRVAAEALAHEQMAAVQRERAAYHVQKSPFYSRAASHPWESNPEDLGRP
jgi:hypothetical protein